MKEKKTRKKPKQMTAIIGRWITVDDMPAVFDKIVEVAPTEVEAAIKALAPGDYTIYTGRTRKITVTEKKVLVIEEQ